MRFSTLVIAVSVFWCVTARAEVFTLRLKGKASGGSLDTCLKSTALLTEPLHINGAGTELKLSLVRMNLTEILTLLRKQFPDAEFAAGGDTVLVKQLFPDGSHQRLLLVYFGDFLPILQLAMTLPPQLPRPKSWPDELTITSDGVPLRYLYFPKRDSWYGRFKTAAAPAQALAEVNRSLRAQGWTPMTGEASSGYRGQGEIFLKKQPLAIMLVNFSPNGMATVFSRRMK
ncbi:MAG: hypothetical protein PHH77_00505 [Victivallaceae bacterium]|nr:hypothetical protein [Victivallaceae bacterium]